MEIDREWYNRYVDGKPEAEERILKIALCRKYQKDYTDIDAVCKAAGLYPPEIEAIKQWKQHDIGDCINERNRLLSYIQYSECERYNKALLNYYRECNR